MYHIIMVIKAKTGGIFKPAIQYAFLLMAVIILLYPVNTLAVQTCTTTTIPGANDFKGISGVSDTNVITAGKNGDIYQWNGTSWSQMTSPTGEDLDDIFMLADGTAYAVGKKNGGQGTVIHYNGSTWSSVTSGAIADEDLKGVWAYSASEVWVVGKKGALAMYNGTSWNDVSGAAGVGNNDLEKVWGDSSYTYVLDKDGDLYIYDRSGGIWSTSGLCAAAGIDFKDLWVDGAGDVILAGKNGAICRYNGATCTSDATASENLEGIHGSQATGEIYAVGKKGVVMYYDGSSWQETSQGTEDLKDVWVSSAGNVYYSGKNAEVTVCTRSITVDHYAISHDGLAINCQAEPVTISGDDAAHAVITDLTGTVTLSTSTGHGDWTMITGNPANLVNAGNGSATYTFDGSENGTVILGLKDTFAETVNINVTDGTVSELSGAALVTEDNDLVFDQAGFNFLGDWVLDNIGPQIADKPSNIAPGVQLLEIQAIRTNDDTGACEGALTGSHAIDLAFECLDPAICTANQVSINGSPITGNNAGTSPLSSSQVNLDFGSDIDSTATFTMVYPDSGQLRLHARYDIPLDDGNGTPSGNLMLGASNSFVARPFAFEITATGNPAAADATGPVFTQAGADFTASVRAVAWQAADDADNNGIADGHDDTDPANNADLSDNSAPLNFGLETATETVQLAATLVQPAGGNDPGLGGTTGISTFAAGAGSTTIQYGEVGIIEIAATIADGDFLGIGAADTAAVTGRSGDVGRFTPDHFNVTIAPDPPTLLDACAAGLYTYLGASFSFTNPVVVTITAQNLLNVKTQNYENSFWKLSEPFSVNHTYADSTAPAAAVLAPANSSVSLSAGTTASCNGLVAVTLTDTFSYSRPPVTSPELPFATNIDLAFDQAQFTDSDGICFETGGSCSGFTRNGITGATMRHGRALATNAYGPETADAANPLLMPLRTEYYDNTGNWAVNTDDTCTQVSFAITPTTPPTITTSTSAGSPITMTAGTGNLDLWPATDPAPPGGSVTVDYTLPAWLQPNLTAEAFFGIYRGNDRIINWREIKR